MTNKRDPSFDLDDGRLDLDRADAFDADVKIPDVVTPQPPAAGDSSVEEIARERDRLKDQLLRQVAEFDNYRKRVDRERRDQADQTVVNLLQQLLAIIDDFERALRADPREDPEGYRKGVELIHRQLMDVLRRRGVEPIDALGADFDPHVHQAVTQELSPAHRDGEVIEELRRGYKIGDRLLRPAMVKVATSS